MSLRSMIRNVVNAVRRPSAVTRAQHRHLQLNPKCAACGSSDGCQAHHVQPYNKFPDLGANPNNFITLCERGIECHLHVGHGGNFKMYNPDVREDAADYLSMNDAARRVLLDRIRAKRLPDVA